MSRERDFNRKRRWVRAVISAGILLAVVWASSRIVKLTGEAGSDPVKKGIYGRRTELDSEPVIVGALCDLPRPNGGSGAADR